MKVYPTPFADAWLLEADVYPDPRGYFGCVYSHSFFEQNNLNTRWVQTNQSWNEKAGTLRGLHYQQDPYGEIKLVSCARGAIFDVMVDLRPNSPTYRQWYGAELSDANRRMLYVPKGFAHGYQTLVDDTLVFYQVSHEYEPSAAAGARWDDPSIGIQWPEVPIRILSDRDQDWPLLG